MGICRTTEHPERDSVIGDLYLFLGNICHYNNEKEKAHEYMHQSFAIQKKISDSLRSVDDRLALAYSEQGIAFINEGRYEEGIENLKTQRTIRESYGPYIPQARDASLAYAYLKLGKLNECEMLLEESLRVREEFFGKGGDDSLRLVACYTGQISILTDIS
jgi:tetratricopeptide (TPR) repeat protein